MLYKNDVIEYLTVSMKEHGYRKSRNNWKKQCEYITIIITIQSSQYNTNTFYVCFGVSINAIAERPPASAHMCHIQARIDGNNFSDMEHIMNAIELWGEKYGTLESLKRAAFANKLPIQSKSIAVTYLTSINNN